MVFRLIEWLPDHRFRLVADGAFASLLRYELPRTAVITRLRCDAALYDLAPARTGRRGRPRTKGKRLAAPLSLAALADADWTTVQVCVRGQIVERKLWSRTLLWYETTRSFCPVGSTSSGSGCPLQLVSGRVDLPQLQSHRPTLPTSCLRHRDEAPRCCSNAPADRPGDVFAVDDGLDQRIHHLSRWRAALAGGGAILAEQLRRAL